MIWYCVIYLGTNENLPKYFILNHDLKNNYLEAISIRFSSNLYLQGDSHITFNFHRATLHTNNVPYQEDFWYGVYDSIFGNLREKGVQIVT